jgi:hypothetical protein
MGFSLLLDWGVARWASLPNILELSVDQRIYSEMCRLSQIREGPVPSLPRADDYGFPDDVVISAILIKLYFNVVHA